MSEKINELVMHVKEYINLGEKQSQESTREIQNQIDDKNLEIRDIVSRNLDATISHYIRYQETISHQKRLENQCEQFSKRIEKTQNLSLYDENMVERGEKTIQLLKAKKMQIVQFRDSVAKLKKAAISIEEQRYNNAIKLINAYKEANPANETPLKKVLPIFREKIKTHLIKLVLAFWSANKPKIIDIGCHCYNKIELSMHEKTTIYQTFFGRNSTARNSLIRKSSIIDDGKNEAPLRFLKKVKDEQILQKYILRLDIEMSSLKQMRLLCKQMGEIELFQQIFNKQVRKVIGDLAEEHVCDSESDLKKLLSQFIGFLLFWREVVVYFNIEKDSGLVLGQIYSLIGQQAKSLISRPDSLNQIMRIKQMLDIFHKVLEIVDIDSKTSQYSTVLGEIFKIYCNFSLDQYETVLSEQINQDNLISYSTQDASEEKLIEEILRVKPDQTGRYNFTSFVIYVLQIFNQYYDRMIAFVKDSDLNKSQLHDYLSALLERIIAVYGGLLITKDQHLQIAQGEVNLRFCQIIFRYFSEQLQMKHEYIRVNDFGYKSKLESVIVELRRRMREVVEEKIMMMMAGYENDCIWLPQDANTQPNDFLQWMLEFIRETIIYLRNINNPADEEMTYACVGYIHNLYWDFLEQCKEFTLITIYNLDIDLLFIYKFLNRHFGTYPDLGDKFKPLSQFYSLLLTNNIQDILDKQKRDILYSHLDLHRTVVILKKYNKAKTNANGKIRELKKKDVDNVVKKLEAQFK